MSILRLGLLSLCFVFGCSLSKTTLNFFHVVVSDYDGDVMILRGEDVLPVKLAMSLEINDIVKIPADGYVQLLFSGGALVTGVGETSLQVPKAGIVRLIRGESFYNIEKQQARSFFVQTDRATMEVLGTQFMVSSSLDRTYVAILKGTVSVLTKDGESLLLEDDREVILNDEAIPLVQKIDPDTEYQLKNIYSLALIPHDDYEKENNELRLLSIQLDSEIEELKKKSNILNKDISFYLEETNTLKKETDLLYIEVDTLKREINTLKSQEIDFRKKIENLEQTAKGYESLYLTEQESSARYRQLLEEFINLNEMVGE